MQDLLAALGDERGRVDALATVLASEVLRQSVRHHLLDIGLHRLGFFSLEWVFAGLVMAGDRVLADALPSVKLSLECTANAPTEDPEAWSRLAAARRLWVYGAVLGPDVFRERCPQELLLGRCQIPEGLVLGPCRDLWVVATPLPALPQDLRRLRLYDTGVEALRLKQRQLTGLELREPALLELELDARKLKNAEVDAPLVQTIWRTPRLKSLALVGAQLASLEGLPESLERLELTGTGLEVLDTSPLPKLTRLSVRCPSLARLDHIGGVRQLDLSGCTALAQLPDFGEDPPGVGLRDTSVPRAGRRWRCSWAERPALARLSKAPRPAPRKLPPKELRKKLTALRRMLAGKDLDGLHQALHVLDSLADAGLVHTLLEGLRLSAAGHLRHPRISGPHAEFLLLELLARTEMKRPLMQARRLAGTCADGQYGPDWQAARPLDLRRLALFPRLQAYSNEGHIPYGEGAGVVLPHLLTLRLRTPVLDWLEAAPKLVSMDLGHRIQPVDLGRYPALRSLTLGQRWRARELVGLPLTSLRLYGPVADPERLLELPDLRTLHVSDGQRNHPVVLAVQARAEQRT